MTTPAKRRLAVALEIKAAAMRIIEIRRRAITVGPQIPVLHAPFKGLHIMYTANMPESVETFPPARHVLDILKGGKQFSIRWNDAGFRPYLSFRRGDWESLLLGKAA